MNCKWPTSFECVNVRSVVTDLQRQLNEILYQQQNNIQQLSLVGNNTWLQCCLSRYFLIGHRIFCLLSFLLLVVVVMCYALQVVLDIIIVISSS